MFRVRVWACVWEREKKDRQQEYGRLRRLKPRQIHRLSDSSFGRNIRFDYGSVIGYVW